MLSKLIFSRQRGAAASILFKTASLKPFSFASAALQDEEENPIYRVCLTGGPCSGKTTAIAKMQDIITKSGYRVFQVPEAATLLMQAGAMIDITTLNAE